MPGIRGYISGKSESTTILARRLDGRNQAVDSRGIRYPPRRQVNAFIFAAKRRRSAITAGISGDDRCNEVANRFRRSAILFPLAITKSEKLQSASLNVSYRDEEPSSPRLPIFTLTTPSGLNLRCPGKVLSVSLRTTLSAMSV